MSPVEFMRGRRILKVLPGMETRALLPEVPKEENDDEYEKD
jgi:hypothetical protein